MPEGGILSGLLSSEEAEQRRELDVGSSEASAVATVIALDQAKHDPELSREAGAYLREQRALAKKQRALVRHQLESSIEDRKEAEQDLRLKRFGDRLKATIQAFGVAGAAVLAVAIASMVYDAFSSRTVVLDSFDTPAGLAPRGLTGRVVAGAVLDELTRLQSATRSAATKRQVSNAWTGDIKIEVPSTGISIGEINRLLKERFGHDVHVGGDLVVNNTGGLVLTVRGTDILPKSFSGPQEDLAKLTTQAAEYIYGESEPSIFIVYLTNAGRNAEAVAFAKAVYPSAPIAERPYILNGWANAWSNIGAAGVDVLPLYQEAIKLKPDYWVGYNNIINSLWTLGREEEAWRTGEQMLKLGGKRPGKIPEIWLQNFDTLTWNLGPWALSLESDATAHAGVGTLIAPVSGTIADVYARMHNPRAALFQLQTAHGDAKDPTVAALDEFVRGELAADAGDLPGAYTHFNAFARAYADPIVSSNYPGFNCFAAPAEEMAGHPDEADATLKVGGRFVDCYRFRGDILDHRNDWPAAQRAYAEAVALAPDLPAPYYSWGMALARHGDLAGAAAKLSLANAKGPTWADPLKAWGDVLMRQGRRAEAQAKYDQALKFAPAWGALHQAMMSAR